MISGKQRSYLKSLAHDLKPIVNIGKNSLTDEVLTSIDEALEKRELIKIKILNNNLDDNDEIVDEVIEKLNCEFVSHLGNIFTIYRESKKNKKIDL